jgi:glutaconate CoA-transferase subunit A
VDAVVVEPRGCHPSYAQGFYDRDNPFYREWDQIARDRERLEEWLREWVYGVSGRAEYAEKLGETRWAALAPGERLSGEVNYGVYA